MNTQSILKQLLSSDALKGITSSTGVTGSDVSNILSQALPQLLSGANKQATSKSTAESFAQALMSHSTDKTTNLTSFFKNVDLEDGAKIVSHLLGSSNKTVSSIASKTSTNAKDVSNVLSAAAPLLMSLLGQNTSANKKNADITSILSSATSLLGNSDVTSLATSLLKNIKIEDNSKKTSTKKATTTKKTNTKKTSTKTTSKKKNDVDLSDGVDLNDVIKIAKKLMK